MARIGTLVLGVGLGLCLTNCDRQKLDTKEYAQELKEKKLKRVTQGEIMANAQKLGDLLADTLDFVLTKAPCDLNNLPVVKTFVKDFDAKVNIYTEVDTIQMDSLTKQVFQATAYGVAQGIDMAQKPNIQNLKNEYWLYSKPLSKGKCNATGFALLCIVISQPEMIRKLN